MDEPKVAILMGVYEGEKYLPQQLKSFENQTWTHWDLYASIDGKSLACHELLEQASRDWQGRHGVSIYAGPGQGFVANFLSLICNPAIQADYYACSDQDDEWMSDKLTRALAWLGEQDPDRPALYCSRTRLIDQAGQPIGLSRLMAKPPSFANALVQNIAGGNTMVFNQAARNLLIKAGLVDVPCHDWWVYLAVTACGGTVCYDPQPTVLYRQHTDNLIGDNNGWRARFYRLSLLLNGQYRVWNDRNVVALQELQDQMQNVERKKITDFNKSRSKSILKRLYFSKRSGIYKQSIAADSFMLIAIICNKN